jgi:hypothetical protein
MLFQFSSLETGVTYVIPVHTARYFAPVWSYPLWILGGFLLWTIFMHLARGVGQLHGRMAKSMLVTD